MLANKTILQMKYARIVKLFAEKAHWTYEDALGFFYDSVTYPLLPNRQNAKLPNSSRMTFRSAISTRHS